ncbi:MAG: MBL fold metallo-hydrolase [Bacteroidales bacterium]|nr:MBL fold metallo-hydrolase [Bacteroidales bacterium]
MTLIIITSIIVSIILGINLFIWLHPTFGAKKKFINQEKLELSPNFKNGKFQNIESTTMMTSEGSRADVMKKFFTGVDNGKPSEKLQTVKFNKDEFASKDSGINYSWLGHSTVLININGQIIITDPVFTKAASPVPFFNKSFDFENEYSVDILPEIDVVLISHDHYDHLDYKTIKKIDSKTKKFVVPLGVEAHLLRWGISAEKIEIADWGNSIRVNSDLLLTSTPARHFSGRGTRDRDKTLWCSWVIESKNEKVFFGGDSGYGNHFKDIGEKYGPFDLTLIECGQYNENWSQIHAMPEQTIQAHIDLKGKTLLPIHWSKFRLSVHTWTEPIERATKASIDKKVSVQNPIIGEIISLNKDVIENYDSDIQIFTTAVPQIK